MNDKIEVSIVIVSFNAKTVLKSCLDSINDANLGFSHEIIVVDNASSDGVVDMVHDEYPTVRLIKNHENNLFAKANNQGAAIARGRYLLLLNNDVLVDESALERLLAFIEGCGENVACVGPIVLNEDRTLQSAGYALPSIRERITMVFHLNRLLPRLIARIVLPTGTPGLYESNHKTGWISGCCMLIRRDIYTKMGGLNEALEFYGEEPEFCMRLLKHGWETWLVADAHIVHLGGQSSSNHEASFLSDREGKLRRYTALQRHTVGLRHSLVMSRIVLLSAYLKRLMSKGSQRDYFTRAIDHERAVINYMKRSL